MVTTSLPALPDTFHSRRWLARLEEIEAFIAEHGRKPKNTAEPSQERNLSMWLRDQKATRTLAPERRLILDARLPGWDKREAAAVRPFREGVRDLKLYRDAYGSFPSSRAKDESVLRLAQWLNALRHQKKLTAEELAHLDEQIPGWNETVEETWQRTAREVAVYRDRHGEMPSLSSKEYPVRRLAKWLADFRRGRGMTPERTAFLDAELPGWREGRPYRKPIEAWEQRLDAVVRFTQAHGRLPRTGTRNRDEAKHGDWLDRQRADELLTEHRRTLLTSNLPGWDTVPARADRQVVRLRSFEQRWGERLVEVTAFVESNGRLPAASRGIGERCLYEWLLKQRHAATLSEERRMRLDQNIPGWRGRGQAKTVPAAA
jgi:hypothetical protein